MVKKRKRKEDDLNKSHQLKKRLETLRIYFESNLKKDDCWLWKDEHLNTNQCNRSIQGTTYTYRQIIYHLETGNSLTRMRIRMKCRDYNCFNPAHMVFTPSRCFEDLTDDEVAYYRDSLNRLSHQQEEHRLWDGAIIKEYGTSTIFDRSHQAHVTSWCLEHRKKVPEGMIVRHKCKYKTCISPQCLEIGTAADNSRDRIRDGTSCQGSKHPRTTLTDAQVLEIYASRDCGTQKDRSIRFNTTLGIIKSIDTGRSWNSVTKLPKRNGFIVRKRPTKEDYAGILDRLRTNCEMTEDGHWLWKGHIEKGGYGISCLLWW